MVMLDVDLAYTFDPARRLSVPSTVERPSPSKEESILESGGSGHKYE
jgi:hypothetical protein